MAREVRFHIDGKGVPRAEFDRLFETLRQTGGWYCEKMPPGGRTGWEAEDPRGLRYRYTATSEDGVHTREISPFRRSVRQKCRIPPPAPSPRRGMETALPCPEVLR